MAQPATRSLGRLSEIAQVKLQDLNTDDLDAAKRQVVGTARSMGVAVSG